MCSSWLFAQPVDQLSVESGLPSDAIALLGEKTALKPVPLVLRNAITNVETRMRGVMSEARSEKSWEIVNALAPELRKRGILIFVCEENFNFGGQPNKIAMIKSSDQYDVIRMMKTQAIDLGLDNAAMIAKIKEWDGQTGLIITGAGPDWIQANFIKQPENMRNFAKEVYKFCQDVVEQGAGTIDNLGTEMARTNVLYLWWD